MHYSIDNSQCLNTLSKCNTLDFTGVDLTRASNSIQQETPENVGTMDTEKMPEMKMETVVESLYEDSIAVTSCASESSESQFDMGLSTSSHDSPAFSAPSKTTKYRCIADHMSTPLMNAKFALPQHLNYTPISHVRPPQLHHISSDSLYEFDAPPDSLPTLDLSQYDNLGVSETRFGDTKDILKSKDAISYETTPMGTPVAKLPFSLSTNYLEKETHLIRGMNTF